MKKRYTRRFAVMMWLSLIGLLPMMAQVTKPIEIKSMEQLQEVLSSPRLRSDAVTDLPITANGILVDKNVSVNAGSYRMHGGPLIRAEGYTGILLTVKAGGNIAIENTIDGANIDAQNMPLIQIEKEGILSLEKDGVFKNNKGIEHALCLLNYGLFNLNGGTITGNLGGGNHVIANFGVANLNSGQIVKNEASGSVYVGSPGTVSLNSSNVTLNGTDATLFVERGSPLKLTSSLKYEITIETVMDEGDIVAVGSGNYRLTENDLAKMIHKSTQHPDLVFKLENNQVILSKPSSGTGEITTPEELQDAINKAPGTVNNPTVIEIKGDITLTKTIEITNKYVILTGGTISNGITTDPATLFKINSGQLIFQKITIDGGNTGPAMPYHMSCLVNLQGGTVIMNEGAILTGAGLTGDVSAVWIFKGEFIMNGGQITKNYFYGGLSMASVVSIYDGSFTMNGGEIFNNVGSDYYIVGLFGYSSKVKFVFNGGMIYQNTGGYLRLATGDFIIDKNTPDQFIRDAIQIQSESVIYIKQRLLFTLTIQFNVNWTIPDNFVLARGYSGYQITEDDLKKIKLPDGYTLVLSNNTIIIKKSGSSGEITDVDGLQAAIDAASVGSIDNPTLITINKSFAITKTILIKKKHIKLTGETLTAGVTTANYCRMFDVMDGGALILEKITLDGKFGSYCSFARVDASSSFIMHSQAILQSAQSGENWLSLEIAGSFVMDGGTIRNNVGNKCPVIYLAPTSKWTYTGGNIIDNKSTVDNAVYSIVTSLGQATLKTCEIIGNSGIAILCGGSINIDGASFSQNTCALGLSTKGTVYVKNNRGLNDQVYYLSESGTNYLAIQSSLVADININVVSTVVKEGFVLAKGSGYTLTESDLKRFVLTSALAKNWIVKLVDNTVVLSKEGSSSDIDTQEKLQAAIDASKGTASAPATITISKEILIYRSILIRNKYVKLTGGILKNAASADLRMFDVGSGYLGLTNITLDGNKKNATGYCTLIEMNGGSCELLEGTTLTNALARGGSDAVVSIAHGSLAFKAGSISGNTSEGGDVIWVSGSGNFSMTGGSVTGNNNSGRYIMAAIEMTYGVMNLSGGSIGNNSGNRYGLYVTKPFTLGGNAKIEEVIILSGEGKILVSSALKNKVTIGYMKTNMPSGTIVASGTGNYKLTEADVKQFTYRYANTYSFSLSGNDIVLTNLDAVNKLFNVKVETYKDGILSVDRATAKENELVTVTVKPASGKKLYTEMLRYNDVNKLTSTNKENVYTFKMPPANVLVTASFIPEQVHVEPVDTAGAGFKPDDDLIPDGAISDLETLIDRLGGGNPPMDMKPEANPVPENKLSDPLSDAVDKAKGNGDDVIGSLAELITLVTKNTSGVVLTTEVLYALPSKVTLRVYLPNRLIVSEQLRASGTSNYYILNECEGNVTRIEPTYDPNENTLMFSTDKLGTFVVLNENTPTANGGIVKDNVQISVVEGQIVVKGLQHGAYYTIYDFSGRLLKRAVYKGETVLYRPELSGSYIIDYSSGSRKVFFSK